MITDTKLVWQELNSLRGEFETSNWRLHRTKVPGGWLVLMIHDTTSLMFYPDPEHRWDGGNLD